MSFDTLGLAEPIIRALEKQGYQSPTPIQSKAIPVVLTGKDLLAAAQTGTGKTASFTLPILQRLSTGKPVAANRARTLILTPTRELAAQVAESVSTYSQFMPLSHCVVYGGVKINPQMMKLRRGADILVATPGRLLDLYQQNAIRFNDLEILVLDEADRMLDMGFIHDIRKIIALLPPKRQTLLFSATFSPAIRQLAKSLMQQPEEISVAPQNTTASAIKQSIIPVDKGQKSALLAELINQPDWTQVLVFCRTKHGANKLTKKLDNIGVPAAAIHSNKSQGARTRALAEFKSGKLQALIATDIAARGLDIDKLPHVVNFDLPDVAEDYVHRIGRTGRAGAVGEAISLVCIEEQDQLRAIQRLIGEIIPIVEVPGFTPTQPLKPMSIEVITPPKRKRPKKKKRLNDQAQQQETTLSKAKNKPKTTN
ncbi:DEAD/DEAH box helicase [Methylophaga sp. OBS3]|uniref:DEAD/DEAH box helicase n=1 Tax=Methylophaga sp. OBS3 TaxID=2991934 RepID=UPI0022540B12|nr:DEAD/DEAH box helicase [Methylophaga sp. OBS3]MCX4189782.1 DEAD/DEAH box helicase [Methylophaga sp. OBS3]